MANLPREAYRQVIWDKLVETVGNKHANEYIEHVDGAVNAMIETEAEYRLTGNAERRLNWMYQ